MHPVRLFAAVALATVLLTSPTLAQGIQAAQAVPAAQAAHAAPGIAVSGAPVLARQAVGVRRLADAPTPVPHPAPFRADTRQNRALMIVGGAGMLTGLVIGGDAGGLISVGGAVVFLWGLYQFLN